LVRIARYAAGDDPTYGIVTTIDGADVISPIHGDPLYSGITPYAENDPAGQPVGVEDVRLLAPVIPRSKVVCVGRNYAEHAAELGNELSAEPLIFLKPNTSVIGPHDPIVYPLQSERVDFEGELAVVISRICRDVPRDRVADVIFGYTIGNDVTARDLQNKDDQWTRAKGFDSFCPLGPWIETELDVSDVNVETTLNGVPKQSDRTSHLVFDIPTIIAYITSVMTLLPGDVVLTGTPAGVGPMQPGDEVTVTIEGIGALTNRVVARD
jgi:2-keto-4-pentenoate hydratase/2-oxohepta-3-ene-1,7-dioic acid hydratase in catechol pathway